MYLDFIVLCYRYFRTCSFFMIFIMKHIKNHSDLDKCLFSFFLASVLAFRFCIPKYYTTGTR